LNIKLNISYGYDELNTTIHKRVVLAHERLKKGKTNLSKKDKKENSFNKIHKHTYIMKNRGN
jgi:hypothetical protein